MLGRFFQTTCFDDVEQIGFCPVQIIVDDNIVKQDGLFDFVTRFGEAGLDDFLAVGAAPDKAFGKDFERRRQDEDAARFGQAFCLIKDSNSSLGTK